MIYAIAFVAVAVVNHRVAEIIYVATGLPGGGMHEDGSVNAHDVFIHARHGLPPMIFYIFFEFASPLSIIVHGSQPIINFTRRKYESILFAMTDNCLKPVAGFCHGRKCNSKSEMQFGVQSSESVYYGAVIPT